VIALTALGLFGVGLWLSDTPAPFAPALAGALTFHWRALGAPWDLSNACFVAGMVVASSLIVFYLVGVYVVGLREHDPRKRRYKA
jgi:hypothetical protein